MVAELFLSPFLQVLFERLTPRIGDLWKLAFREGFEKTLEAFVKLFGKIEDVLADSEEKQLTKRDVKIWLDDLKDLAYDAEDVLDEFSTEALRREVMAKQQTTTSKYLNLMFGLNFNFKRKMGSKLDAIMSRLEDISIRKNQLSLLVSAGGASGSTNTWQPTPTTPELDEPVVYGRVKDKDNIIHLLLTDDQKRKCLRLSYYYLPPHLKKCFVYCVIFPQDYKFTEEELVLLWIAEGLIQQKERREEELIQEGHAYFRGLVSRSLLQASNDDGSKYTMHDLVHDLAKEVGGELYFLLNDVSESHKEIGRARHFSYINRDCDISKRFEIFLKTKHLRTFLPFQMMRENYQYVSCSVLNLTFRLKKLRVLSIHGYQITELSDSVGNLKHLRYLDLSSTQIRCLPETTCSLHNLLILSLRNCEKLRALPSKMGNLINLFYLDIINDDRLKEMPIGLKELKSLQMLSNFIVGKSNGCGLKELMNFKDLSGKIHISSLDNVVDAREAKEASLDKKNNLKVLVLEWSSNFNDSRDLETEKSVLQLLQPNQNIEELTIISYGGNAFSTWLGDPLFFSMNMLKLENCKLCTCLPPLGQLPFLKTLKIRGMHGVKSVGAEFNGSPHSKTFPSLESVL